MKILELQIAFLLPLLYHTFSDDNVPLTVEFVQNSQTFQNFLKQVQVVGCQGGLLQDSV